MRNYPSVSLQVPNILLPKPGTDLKKWAVIACDQFSSEPEYWDEVKKIVAGQPSTYEMILPEVMLGTSAEPPRIQSTQAAMRQYLDTGIFQQVEGLGTCGASSPGENPPRGDAGARSRAI